MMRKYKRKRGSRRYADSPNEQLELSLQALKSGQITQKQASEHFNIPCRILVQKLKEVHLGLPRPASTFASEEEVVVAAHAETMSEFGPLIESDLRITNKIYLDRCGRTVENLVK